MSKRMKAVSFVALIGLLVAGPASALASVDCDSGGDLQAAIDDLDPLVGNTITVTGTCNQQISIAGHRSLRINGPATIASASGTPVTVTGGTRLELCGLTIDGGAAGIFVRGSTVLTGNYCGGLPVIVKNSTSYGVVLAEKSHFTSSFTFIVENAGVAGISVQDSSLDLASSGAPGAAPSIIRNNGFGGTPPPGAPTGGIIAFRGSLVVLTRIDVLNNRGAGVNVEMGGVLEVRMGNVTGNTGPGVVLSDNSTGRVRAFGSPVGAITGNTGGGVVVTKRSALGLLDAPVISGNTGGNLVCSVGGDAYGDASNVPGVKKDCKSFEAVPNN